MRSAIRKFCTRIGKDPLLVQGAGGNVSWKDGGTLWVKASGTWLANAGNSDIFVPVDLRGIRGALQESSSNESVHHPPKGAGRHALRPSIETSLHGILPHKVVVHLHAVEALAVLVRARAYDELQDRLDPRVRWEFVEYRQPGAALAKAVSAALRRTPDADVVFLQNHGLIVAGDTVNAVERRIADVIAALKQDIPVEETGAEQTVRTGSPHILEPTGPVRYAAVENPQIQSIVHRKELYRRLSTAWALYPDHVVFLGAKALVFDSRDHAAAFCRTHRPLVVFIRSNGVFARQEFGNAGRAQLRCYYEVLVRQKSRDALVELSQSDVDDLTDWEAERYRANRNLPNTLRDSGGTPEMPELPHE